MISATVPVPDSTAPEPTMRAHSLADVFPLIEGDTFNELVASIRANGLRDPIMLYQGQILDGRNRYLACGVAGVKPRYETFGERGDPLQFVIDRNMRRRHLDSSQRAMIAAKIETLKHGGDRKSDQDANLHVDRAAAAKLMNVSARSVANAAKVRDRAAPEIVAAVERGTVAVSTAAKAVASSPKTASRNPRPNARARQVKALSDAWAEASPAAQEKFLDGLGFARLLHAVVRNAGAARVADAALSQMDADDIRAVLESASLAAPMQHMKVPDIATQ
jgi:ParB-like chromosome segregation protein Spo0J